MFELLNDDLDQAVEILRRMSVCESKNEQLLILAEERIDKADIEKTIELCQLLCYYYEKTRNK